jgi:glycine oxidase
MQNPVQNPLQNLYDVIVVGGGAIGCSIAWKLSQSGRKVLLLERGQLGGEASSAAGGMLGAQLEVGSPGPFFHLCMESRSLYRFFAAELYEETGIDVGYTENGILRVASTEEEAQVLKDCMAWQIEAGGQAKWLSKDEAVELEPGISAELGALLLPLDGNVTAPLLTRALGFAATKRATVIEGAEVLNISLEDDFVRVVTTNAQYKSEKVVVAAGAWADKVLGSTGAGFGISPVKGQMFSMRPTGKVTLTRTIFRDHAYLVPKRDGTIVVGATEEHQSGYNRNVTVDALSYLFSAVKKIAPGLEGAEFERAWIGFRPKSRSGFPSIGPVSWNDRLLIAAGHFRNGILLAPVTAKMLVAHMNNDPIRDIWANFIPDGTERQISSEAEVLS